MNRVRILALSALLLVSAALPAQAFAQDNSTLTYGQTVKGEVTASKNKFTYTFKAAENDVVD